MNWIPTKDIFDRKTKDRFFKFIDRMQAGECWNWNGSLAKNGYGEFYYNSRPVYAHRFSYELFFGPFPTFALVLHKCDNKRCINPNHLYLGTYTQNLNDSYERHPETKGRRWYKDREVHQCL